MRAQSRQEWYCTVLGEYAYVTRSTEFRRIKRTRNQGLLGLMGLKLIGVSRCNACGRVVQVGNVDIDHGGNSESHLRRGLA